MNDCGELALELQPSHTKDGEKGLEGTHGIGVELWVWPGSLGAGRRYTESVRSPQVIQSVLNGDVGCSHLKAQVKTAVGSVQIIQSHLKGQGKSIGSLEREESF